MAKKGRLGKLWGIHVLAAGLLALGGALGQACSRSDVVFPELSCIIPVSAHPLPRNRACHVGTKGALEPRLAMSHGPVKGVLGRVLTMIPPHYVQCPVNNQPSQCQQVTVAVGGVSYCCLCIENGAGGADLKLCPKSARPPRSPAQPATPPLATGDLSGVMDTVFDTGLPSRAISADVTVGNAPVTLRLAKGNPSEWGASDHLMVFVTQVSVIPPNSSAASASGTAAVAAACNRSAAAGNSSQVSNCTNGTRRAGQDPVVWYEGEHEQAYAPSAGSGWDEFAQGGGLVAGGLDHRALTSKLSSSPSREGDAMHKHHQLLLPLSKTPSSAGQRRFMWPKVNPVNLGLMWMLQAGGVADLTQAPPLYDYMLFGQASVSVIDYDPRSEYYITLNVPAPFVSSPASPALPLCPQWPAWVLAPTSLLAISSLMSLSCRST